MKMRMIRYRLNSQIMIRNHVQLNHEKEIPKNSMIKLFKSLEYNHANLKLSHRFPTKELLKLFRNKTRMTQPSTRFAHPAPNTSKSAPFSNSVHSAATALDPSQSTIYFPMFQNKMTLTKN